MNQPAHTMVGMEDVRMGLTKSSSAKFSPCRKFRYELFRWWDQGLGYAMFIGLNPSTADEVQNDPTVRRCIRFAQDWGFGGLCMTNIFAFRSTDPYVMECQEDPVGPENDKFLVNLAEHAGIVIAAWGTHGQLHSRGHQVMKMIPGLMCLGQNQDGSPKHPLYLPASCKPIPIK